MTNKKRIWRVGGSMSRSRTSWMNQEEGIQQPRGHTADATFEASS